MAHVMTRTLLARLALAAGLAAWVYPAAVPRAQAPVRGAHELAKDPRAFTDDLDLTVPGTPIDHPARVYPASETFPTGPAIGERLPDFTLPDQGGRAVNFHADRGASKAVVSFQRSAVW